MVLRPLEFPAPKTCQPGPAWPAIAERQKWAASGYCLIRQPEHAHLSGELAAHFVSGRFPAVYPLLARVVSVHDSGWGSFPGESRASEPLLLTAEGRPRAFIEFAPLQFLQAWTASIESARQLAPAGGIVVSRHFCELGKFRLQHSDGLTGEERELIRAFLGREQERQKRLRRDCPQSATQLDQGLAVLQFCDLLSLYLCCGAEGEADFPPGVTDRPVRITHPPGESGYRLDPSPFHSGSGSPLRLEVNARLYPPNGAPQERKLQFVLW